MHREQTQRSEWSSPKVSEYVFKWGRGEVSENVCGGGMGVGMGVGVGREWEETQRSLTGGLIEQAQMSVMGGGGYMSMPKVWLTEGAKLL